MFNSQSTDDNSFFWSSFGLRLWDNADGPFPSWKNTYFSTRSRVTFHIHPPQSVSKLNKLKARRRFIAVIWNEWMNPLGKRVDIHFSSSPDTPLLSQELLASSRAVCVWAPPSWTNLPKDPPSKTAALHKKAQTDTLIILKPCGTGCLDLKSSSPFYHKITVNYSLAICCCCCGFLPPTKSLWWFTIHFSAQVTEKSLAEDDQKDSVAFQSRCVPFLSTTDDFHASTIVGRECEEKGEFLFLEIPLAFCCWLN